MQSIQQLIEIMRALRDPASGCPWDLEQNFQSLIPYTIEEAYEVADAIERNNIPDLKGELGDLLFQVVFYSQLAEEQKAFDFNQVALAICDKLIRRHPHVFADAEVRDAKQQTMEWEKIKQQEREARRMDEEGDYSVLDDVSRTLPSNIRAEKLQKRAARVRFDWPDVQGVMAKISEELDEVQQELDKEIKEPEKLQEEIGDLLFSCVNLARFVGVDSEQCLRKANRKFEQRFRRVERYTRDAGLNMAEMTTEQLESVWQKVKAEKNTLS